LARVMASQTIMSRAVLLVFGMNPLEIETSILLYHESTYTCERSIAFYFRPTILNTMSLMGMLYKKIQEILHLLRRLYPVTL
jgi:hypothetical protein